MHWLSGSLARLYGPALIALVLCVTPVMAQQQGSYRVVTAGDLLAGIMDGALADWVQDPAERHTLSTIMATSYILGVADGARDRQWCPADDMEVQAVAGTVLDYLVDLPEDRHNQNAAVIVAEALGTAYPCRR